MIYSFAATLFLFIMWVVLADIRKYLDKDKYGWYIVYPAYLYLAAFLLVDVLYNFTVGTGLFASLPKWGDWTLSMRLKRVLKEESSDSLNYKIAYFFCKYLISPWDYNHCGIGLGK